MKKNVFSFKNVLACDVIIVVQATDVSEYLTFTLRVLIYMTFLLYVLI